MEGLALDRKRTLARLARLALAGLLGAAWGCAEPIHPLALRCQEALDYHDPSHGRILGFRRGPAAEGWEVTIRYAAERAPGPDASRSFTCEYPTDDLWTFRRIALDGHDLPQRQLALVNAELFLRDLRHRPQRFQRSAPPDAVSAAPRAPGARSD